MPKLKKYIITEDYRVIPTKFLYYDTIVESKEREFYAELLVDGSTEKQHTALKIRYTTDKKRKARKKTKSKLSRFFMRVL